MGVQDQEGVGVEDHQGAGRLVDAHPLGAPRWAARTMDGPCPVIAVSMAVVPPTPNRGVMAAATENEVRHGMVAGNSREVVIDQAIGLVIVIPINPESGSIIASVNDRGIVLVIEREIDPVIASVIVRKNGSVIGPVPTVETRTPSVRSLKTIAQGLGVYAIGTIVTAIAVVPEMNGANRLSGPDPVSKKVVPSGRMQHRRLRRPYPQRTI